MSYLSRIRRIANHGPVRARRAATQARVSAPVPKPGIASTVGSLDQLGAETEALPEVMPPQQTATDPTTPASIADQPSNAPAAMPSEDQGPLPKTFVPSEHTRTDTETRASERGTTPRPIQSLPNPGPDALVAEPFVTKPIQAHSVRPPEPLPKVHHDRASALEPAGPRPSAPEPHTEPHQPVPQMEVTSLRANPGVASVPEGPEAPLSPSTPDLQVQAMPPPQVSQTQSPPRREPLPTPPSARVMVHIGSVSLEVSAEQSTAAPAHETRAEPARPQQTPVHTSKHRSTANGIWSGHRDFSRQYLRGF